MGLANLLSTLLPASDSDPEPETPATATTAEDATSTDVVHECRSCGTNVSADTVRCPACDGEDIVSYSID
ncbi:hypothetical protein ACFO5R_08375 [Halosolutus amylolyticus]|uniref:Small CPxCG-related zinc finger protein n=1 Tax=Halosolutus amylolyticus TaxID=2932267 RepID=A0ABD5PNB3_9EURY|nr:hypothetical protein [Halosolutus amylolyticus]